MIFKKAIFFYMMSVFHCCNKYEVYSADIKGSDKILSVLLTSIPINNVLVDNIYVSSKKRIFFKNGYYDFNKLEFINNFDNAETFVKIERDYIKVSDEDKSFVKNLLFEPVFNNNVDEALLFFARALSGQVQDKVWSIILGSKDAGKGVIQDSIKTAFKGYIATINADSLIFDKN